MIRKCFCLIGPLYGRILKLIAYGPWGSSIHFIFIAVFRKLYGISDPALSEHKTLGNFFLRDRKFEIGSSPLVSPAEAHLMDGPLPVNIRDEIKIKGMHYRWKDFPEFRGLSHEIKGFHFWNFYLAPFHYHWVHSPVSAQKFEAMRVRGNKLPVNALGRWLSDELFFENERLSFRMQTEEMGWVYCLCVGAMGVSGLESCVGQITHDHWQTFPRPIKKAEKIAGFKLGSSVLLLVERPQGLQNLSRDILVGQSLLKS